MSIDLGLPTRFSMMRLVEALNSFTADRIVLDLAVPIWPSAPLGVSSASFISARPGLRAGSPFGLLTFSAANGGATGEASSLMCESEPASA